MRVRRALLRADQPDALLALANFEKDLRANVLVRAVEHDGGALVLTLEATLRGHDAPFVFADRDGRIVWQPPPSLGISLPDEALDATGVALKPTLHVVLKSVDDGTEFMIPASVEASLEAPDDGPGRVVARGTVRIDPATAAGGAPLTGEWQGRAEFNVAGYRAPTRMRRPVREGGGRLTVRVGDGSAEVAWERSARQSFARRVIDRLLRREREQLI
jgi:hypothetical protein